MQEILVGFENGNHEHFDDAVYLQSHPKPHYIQRVDVEFNSQHVVGIKIFYRCGDGRIVEGQSSIKFNPIAKAFGTLTTSTFTIQEGDYLAEIHGHFTNEINQIGFGTYKGYRQTFGNAIGNYFRHQIPRCTFTAARGSYRKFLDFIAFRIVPLSDYAIQTFYPQQNCPNNPQFGYQNTFPGANQQYSQSYQNQYQNQNYIYNQQYPINPQFSTNQQKPNQQQASNLQYPQNQQYSQNQYYQENLQYPMQQNVMNQQFYPQQKPYESWQPQQFSQQQQQPSPPYYQQTSYPQNNIQGSQYCLVQNQQQQNLQTPYMPPQSQVIEIIEQPQPVIYSGGMDTGMGMGMGAGLGVGFGMGMIDGAMIADHERWRGGNVDVNINRNCNIGFHEGFRRF